MKYIQQSQSSPGLTGLLPSQHQQLMLNGMSSSAPPSHAMLHHPHHQVSPSSSPHPLTSQSPRHQLPTPTPTPPMQSTTPGGGMKRQRTPSPPSPSLIGHSHHSGSLPHPSLLAHGHFLLNQNQMMHPMPPVRSPAGGPGIPSSPPPGIQQSHTSLFNSPGNNSSNKKPRPPITAQQQSPQPSQR